MIRAVLDANVLAPGFLSKTSTTARLLAHWYADQFELVVSEHFLTELVSAYDDRYFRMRISPSQIDRALHALRTRGIMTELTVEVAGIATHREDDLILATALSGDASFLVTQDRQLLKLGSYRGLQIVPPGRLLAILEFNDTPGV